MTAAKTLLLYWRTLVHLRPRQIVHLLRRRLLRLQLPTAPPLKSYRRRNLSASSWISTDGLIDESGRFHFLNQVSGFKAPDVDWRACGMSKLWRYNLHYFDFLRDPACSTELATGLLESWIDGNPVGSDDAWEPYTVSLRTVNWIKHFCCRDNRAPLRNEVLLSLREQAHWLAQNIEYDILANHYLKNGKALFFCGSFFDDSSAERWLATGRAILLEQIGEQLLPDGGHFERSPMYHAIVIEDLLDVLNLAQRHAGLLSDAAYEVVRQKCVAAMEFLEQLCFADGTWPQFNDAALGIAPTLAELRAYAESVLQYEAKRPPAGASSSSLAASGYFVMRDDGDMLVVDCGELGPDYQPGHAHCDMLSYELALDGTRVIVDTGVLSYEPGDARCYARGTRAHNTVVVDGAEQSEIWGVFRVARRARPLYAELGAGGAGSWEFRGAHDGYRRLPGKVEHHRTIEYSRGAGWSIRDILRGGGMHSMESSIHLHPDLEARVEGEEVIVSRRAGAVIARILLTEPATIALEASLHFPEFGCSQDSTAIRVRRSGELPLTVGYRIQKRHVPA